MVAALRAIKLSSKRAGTVARSAYTKHGQGYAAMTDTQGPVLRGFPAMNVLDCRRLYWGAVGLCLYASCTLADNNGDQALIDRGRYVATVSGCNDCHTPGYGMNDGQVPEAQWLTGDRLGWYGPWGTTYPSNLRLLAAQLDEAQWVSMTRSLKTRPPMPWFNLNHMSAEDSRALYHYLRFLGPSGEPAPAYQPPGVDPGQPYVVFPAGP